MADPKQAVPAGVMGEIQSEVPVEAAPLLQFIMRHVKLVVGVVLLLIAGIIATGVYQWRSSQSLREAELALGKVLSGSTTGVARITALEELEKRVPDAMRIGLWLEVAMVAQQVDNYAKAADAFARVGQMDKGALGIVSTLNQADMLLKAGESGKALAVLEPLGQNTPESMRFIVQESIAAAAESAGNIKRAIEAYQALLATERVQDAPFYKARVASLQAALDAGAKKAEPSGS